MMQSCDSQTSTAIAIEPELLFSMDRIVSETSGLVLVNNQFWTHNDSGDGPYLYQLGSSTGKVLKQVKINGVKHTDWEDLTADDEYVYVADFGNNKLTRKNLRILKVSIDSLTSDKSSFIPELVISYNYRNENDKKVRHNAEAIVSYEDQLLIFTKDEGSYQSKVYSLNKEEVKLKAKYLFTLELNGLITGGDYNASKDELYLIAYRRLGNLYRPYLKTIQGFSSMDPSQMIIEEYKLGFYGQCEAVVSDTVNTIYFSSEAQGISKAKLYQHSFPD